MELGSCVRIGKAHESLNSQLSLTGDFTHPILLTFKIFSVCKDFSGRLCGDCG
jgi:hypothetical protein